jgi:CubicO group peptidase (beta-lactamase class C family)
MRLALFFCALLTFMGAAASAGTLSDSGSNTALKTVSAYLDALERSGFTGMVLVESRGAAPISRGYGFSDISRNRKNDPRTIFDIGSITKQFTATAILKLEMQGKLSTDDTLGRYFPNIPPDKAGITLHQLLRHSSGLPGSIGRDYDPITPAAFLDSVLNSRLRFSPGTDFSYSNVGYSVLAMVVEKVSGMSYEDYLSRNLWHPAGMEQTGYTRPAFDESMIAVGYDNADSAWGKPTEKKWDVDGPFWHLKGNGGILSTAQDLILWDHALSGNRVLSDSAKAKMFHPALRKDEDTNSYYGYGWDVHRSRRNTVTYWHNGTNGIFYSDFFRFPEEGATVILLSNKANGIEGIGREISQALLEPNYVPAPPILETKANLAFTDTIISITIRHGDEAGRKMLAKRQPGINLLEQRVNARGYALLNSGNTRDAISVFRLNVLAFPASANAFDSLGEACMNAGDTAHAIENYRKSLALNPGNDNAEKMLKKLLEK